MRIEYSNQFKRDYKKLIKKHYDGKLLQNAINAIVNQDHDALNLLKDHSLSGNWQGFRELHIQKDWLLIYLIKDAHAVLVLTRTGTHQQLLDI